MTVALMLMMTVTTVMQFLSVIIITMMVSSETFSVGTDSVFCLHSNHHECPSTVLFIDLFLQFCFICMITPAEAAGFAFLRSLKLLVGFLII